MQMRAIRQKANIAVRATAIVMLVATASCQPAPAPVVASRPAPSDPVLAYVSQGPIGRTAVVNDPALGGNVVVVINTQYNAASGNLCRSYATTSASLQSQHLACGGGTAWQEVPPLITSSN